MAAGRFRVCGGLRSEPVAGPAPSEQTAPMLQVFQNVAVVPIVVLVALLALVLIARPDRGPGDDGLYAAVSERDRCRVPVPAPHRRCHRDRRDRAQGVLVSFPARNTSFEGATSAGFLTALGGYFGGPENSDTAAIAAVVNGVLAIAAGLVLMFHLRRRQELLASGTFTGSAAERVDRAYLGGICFLTVTVGVMAAAITGYSIMRLVAPDVTGTVRHFEEEQGAAQLIAYGLLTVISFTVFRFCFWGIRGVRDGDGYDDLDDDVDLVEPT